MRASVILPLVLSLAMGTISPSSVAATTQNAPDATQEVATPYDSKMIISPGFLLHLRCNEDPKLNGDFRVSIDGDVFLPYEISLNAAGIKLKAFQSKLEKLYQPYFKGPPKISVSVKQRQYWIKVLGVVKNPGAYLVKERTTLDEALAMASIRTEDLPIGFVRISQGSHTHWVSMEDYLKGGKNRNLPAWQGHEEVLFQLDRPESQNSEKNSPSDESILEAIGPSSRKVQVLGEVRNPGGVSFQRNADGYYYLIQRGGPTRDSDLTEVTVIRKDKKTNENREVFSGKIRDIKEVQEADVLVVNPSRQTSFERGLQNTGIVASILTSIVLTVFVVKK